MESEMLSMFNDVVIGKNLEQQRKMEELQTGKIMARKNPEADGVEGSDINRMTMEQEDRLRQMANGSFEE